MIAITKNEIDRVLLGEREITVARVNGVSWPYSQNSVSARLYFTEGLVCGFSCTAQLLMCYIGPDYPAVHGCNNETSVIKLLYL